MSVELAWGLVFSLLCAFDFFLFSFFVFLVHLYFFLGPTLVPKNKLTFLSRTQHKLPSCFLPFFVSFGLILTFSLFSFSCCPFLGVVFCFCRIFQFVRRSLVVKACALQTQGYEFKSRRRLVVWLHFSFVNLISKFFCEKSYFLCILCLSQSSIRFCL